MGFSSSQKVVGSSYDAHANLAPMGTPYQDNYYYSWKDLELFMIDGYILFLGACISFSSTMESRQ